MDMLLRAELDEKTGIQRAATRAAAAGEEEKSLEKRVQQVKDLEDYALEHGTALVVARASQNGVDATASVISQTDRLLTMLNTLPSVGSSAAVDHWGKEFNKAMAAVRTEAEKQRGEANQVNEAVIGSLGAMNSAKEDMLVKLQKRRRVVEEARYFKHHSEKGEAWSLENNHEDDGSTSYSISAKKGFQSMFQTAGIKRDHHGEIIHENDCFKITFENGKVNIDTPNLGSLSPEDRAGPLKCMLDCAYDNGVTHANLKCENKEIQLEMIQAVLDNPDRYSGMVVKNVALGKFLQESPGSAQVAFDSRPVSNNSSPKTKAQKNDAELERQAQAIFGNTPQRDQFINYIKKNPKKLRSQLLQHNNEEAKILRSLEKDVEVLITADPDQTSDALSLVQYEHKRQMLEKRFEALEKRHGEPNTYDFDRVQALNLKLNDLPDRSEELSEQANQFIKDSLNDMGNTSVSRLICADGVKVKAGQLEQKSPGSLLKQEETASPAYN